MEQHVSFKNSFIDKTNETDDDDETDDDYETNASTLLHQSEGSQEESHG